MRDGRWERRGDLESDPRRFPVEDIPASGITVMQVFIRKRNGDSVCAEELVEMIVAALKKEPQP